VSTAPFQPTPEFLELLAQYSSGTVDEKGTQRLEQLLQDSLDNRRFFRRYLQADTVLRESSCGHIRLASPKITPFPSALREPWYWKAAAVIASLGCLTSLWLSRASSLDVIPPSSTLAVLTQSVDVQWKAGDRSLQTGSQLGSGTLRFERGLVQLEFVNGAVVVAEGPAELELISPKRAICRQGKVRASVPPQAHGFTITAPDMDVEDLGTEFGLAVGRDGKSEVHVIEGEVKMHPKNARPESLYAGQALRWEAGLTPAALQANGNVFTSRQELLSLASVSSKETVSRWQTESARVRQLPETVFHYTFEPNEPWSRTLPNTRPNSEPALNGAVVGCQWGQGRWPGKHALEFKGLSDRVRLHIPGQYTAITLATWVRIESWDRWLSSLLLTDSFKVGAIHWQLSDKGEMILGVNPGSLENHFSPPVISPNDLGRWVFLATTYNEATRSVCHYLDGRLVSTTPIKKTGPLVPADAELGNWTTNQTTGSRARALNGKIDEFTFFARALTPEEIQTAYQTGAPL